MQNISKPKIVIIGGGFAGLNAACQLGRREFDVTLIDKNNYHLFQPLLYQVASGFLTPGDIASPLRYVLARYKSARVLQDEIKEIVPSENKVVGVNGTYSYDILIVATGMETSYFGHDEWSKDATGLKTVQDSIRLRSEILSCFEAAERTDDENEKKKLLTFVIVGGGPTGVELAGAISELSHATIKNEFRNFDPASCRIVLIEGGSRLLSSFSEKSSLYVEKTMSKLGIEVHTDSTAKNIGSDFIDYQKDDTGEMSRLEAYTIIWAAGVRAAPLAGILQKATGAEANRAGRIKVKNDLSLEGFPNIFVLGDIAELNGSDGKPLPGLAPVAMQQGSYVGKLIYNRSVGKETKPFSYFDKGNMAVIGKGRAIAETKLMRLTGFPAWLAWAFIHIYFLIEFENKLIVFFRWVWNYFTNQRGSRLITKF